MKYIFCDFIWKWQYSGPLSCLGILQTDRCSQPDPRWNSIVLNFTDQLRGAYWKVDVKGVQTWPSSLCSEIGDISKIFGGEGFQHKHFVSLSPFQNSCCHFFIVRDLLFRTLSECLMWKTLLRLALQVIIRLLTIQVLEFTEYLVLNAVELLEVLFVGEPRPLSSQGWGHPC